MTDTRDEGVAREARSGPRDAAVRKWRADLAHAMDGNPVMGWADHWATRQEIVWKRSEEHPSGGYWEYCEPLLSAIEPEADPEFWVPLDDLPTPPAARNASEDTRHSDSEATPTQTKEQSS